MTLTRHDDLPLTYVKNVPTGAPDDAELPLVIVLHGRGADANDLADLAPLLNPSDDDGYRFLFPNAPRPFEPYPGMRYGFSWFDGWPAEHQSLLSSRELLLRFIDEAVARYPMPPGKVILCGFSQGGLMSIDCGFRTSQPLAGIVVMSGAVYEEDLPDFRAKPEQRVLIVHGTGDEVIPVLAARRARRILEDHGIEPEHHEYSMGHQVSEESMEAVRVFVGDCLR